MAGAAKIRIRVGRVLCGHCGTPLDLEQEHIETAPDPDDPDIINVILRELPPSG